MKIYIFVKYMYTVLYTLLLLRHSDRRDHVEYCGDSVKLSKDG